MSTAPSPEMTTTKSGTDEQIDFAALHRLGRLVVLGGLDDDEHVVAETLELRPLMSAQRRRDTEPFQLQRVGERTHLVSARGTQADPEHPTPAARLGERIDRSGVGGVSDAAVVDDALGLSHESNPRAVDTGTTAARLPPRAHIGSSQRAP